MTTTSKIITVLSSILLTTSASATMIEITKGHYKAFPGKAKTEKDAEACKIVGFVEGDIVYENLSKEWGKRECRVENAKVPISDGRDEDCIIDRHNQFRASCDIGKQREYAASVSIWNDNGQSKDYFMVYGLSVDFSSNEEERTVTMDNVIGSNRGDYEEFKDLIGAEAYGFETKAVFKFGPRIEVDENAESIKFTVKGLEGR